MATTSCMSCFKVVVVKLLFTVCLHVSHVFGETRVLATAPVNPAKEGGIISIRCQIWDLQHIHKVSLTGPNSVTYTFGEEVIESDNDRVFLAVKQLQDGSCVYFLSITNVARRDAGTYSCKIVNIKGSFREIAQDSEKVDIWYHPIQQTPTCSPTEAFYVPPGIPQTLNCSCMDANPPVMIRWTKSGNHPVSGAVQYTHQGIVTSRLTVIPTSEDDDTVYLCHVISPVFPDFKLTCYAGPMTIEREQNLNDNHDMVLDRIETSTRSDITLVPPQVGQKCSPCHSNSTSMRYWILATIASVIIALLLIMLNVVLFIRLYQMRTIRSTRQKNSERTLQRIADDLYVDLGDGTASTLRSIDLNRVYMTLEGPKKHPVRMHDNLDVGTDRHYMATFLGTTEHEPLE